MWNNHQSLYNSHQFTLFFHSLRSSYTHQNFSHSIHDVCSCVIRCVRVCAIALYIAWAFYVWSLLLTFTQLRFSLARVCVLFFFTLIVSVSLSFIRMASIWKTCTYTWHMFSFFDEQEGQLRIVVRTVQTCKFHCVFALCVVKYKRENTFYENLTLPDTVLTHTHFITARNIINVEVKKWISI